MIPLTAQNIKEILSRNGLKATLQRVAIYRALLMCDNHPTADHIFDLIQIENPSVSLATVYKTLDSLVGSGLARKVKSSDDINRFDSRIDQHSHIYCNNTKQIFDFDDEELHEILTMYFKRKNIENFKLLDIEVQVNGELINPSSGINITG
ncbi:MAG: transcriptional repressor [Bacteroidota bacterium]|nr:transcriptional repressor [Bacteroidota bacterium]